MNSQSSTPSSSRSSTPLSFFKPYKRERADSITEVPEVVVRLVPTDEEIIEFRRELLESLIDIGLIDINSTRPVHTNTSTSTSKQKISPHS